GRVRDDGAKNVSAVRDCRRAPDVRVEAVRPLAGGDTATVREEAHAPDRARRARGGGEDDTAAETRSRSGCEPRHRRPCDDVDPARLERRVREDLVAERVDVLRLLEV